jgi:hypothetical protein
MNQAVFDTPNVDSEESALILGLYSANFVICSILGNLPVRGARTLETDDEIS